MAVLSLVLMERITFYGPTGIFYFSLCRVFILLHRLIGAIFIGEVYFLSSIRSHLLDDAPAVTVSAEWLRDFGFEIGCKVVIEVSQGVMWSVTNVFTGRALRMGSG
jgi:hypothetical protein